MHINLQMISCQALRCWKIFRQLLILNLWQLVLTKVYYLLFLDYWSNSFLWPLLSFAAARAGVTPCFPPPWGRVALRDSNPTNCSLRSYPSFTSFQFQFKLVILQSALLLLRWRSIHAAIPKWNRILLLPRIDPIYPYSLLKVPFILKV